MTKVSIYSTIVKRDIYLIEAAAKEHHVLPIGVREQFKVLLIELAELGSLEEPFAKKLRSYDLFELRVSLFGAWRCIYTDYQSKIIILSFFNKKTQRTPVKEIRKALKRYNLVKKNYA